MSAEAAQAVWNWRFSDKAVRQMRSLLDRNNKADLSPSEHEELESYVRVGLLLDVVRAKALLSLKQVNSAR